MKSRLQGWWRATIVGRSARLLTKAERRKVLAVAILQVLFGLLDLLGIAAVGLLGALAISGIGSRQPGNRVSDALSLLGLESQPLQVQATIIGLAAAFLLIGKTIITVIFSRKIVFFLSRRGARISATPSSITTSVMMRSCTKSHTTCNISFVAVKLRTGKRWRSSGIAPSTLS